MNKKNTDLAINEKPIQSEAEVLIARAIDNNTPVESLERLLAMRRELRQEKAKEEFDLAMSRFQAKCPIISKASVAGSGGYSYKYASLDHIVSQVRELLANEGFSYTFDTRKTDHSLITICHIKHTAGHSEDSQFEIAIDTGARMNISQKDGAASSYGKRYAFCNAFGILTGDEDTDAATPATQERQEETSTHYNITAKQTGFIRKLLHEKGFTEAQLLEKYDTIAISRLSGEQASIIIENLMKLPNKTIEPELDLDEIDRGIEQSKV